MAKIVDIQVSQHWRVFKGLYYIKNIVYVKPDKSLGMLWFEVDYKEYNKYISNK